MKVTWDHYSHIYGKIKMFQTTNQQFFVPIDDLLSHLLHFGLGCIGDGEINKQQHQQINKKLLDLFWK